MKMIKATIWILAAVLALSAVSASFAQSAQNQAATAAPSSQGVLTRQQLEALVAPIALYPDPLLSEVLMASTYPLEVVTADRWVKANANLQGDQLKNAVVSQSWDDSVKSLTATPGVLDMMSTKLDWTQKLGDAVLAQQADVMDAIQRLRQRAQARGKLNSSSQQTVTTIPAQGGATQAPGGTAAQGGAAPAQGSRIIAIEPTDPDTLYVPYYDPAVVYGDWPYPEYPPYYFGAPGYIGTAILAAGIAFGTGYALGRWVANGNRWGGGLNWRNHQINPLRSVNNTNVGNNNWIHNPAHRGGVRYNNPGVADKFGGNRNLGNSKLGNRNVGGGNPGNGNLGNRNVGGGQNRGNLAGKGQGQPGAGNRVNGGNRTGAVGNQKHQARNNANAGNRTNNRASTKHTSTANRGPSGNRSTANRGTNRGTSQVRTTNVARSYARPNPAGGGVRPSTGSLHGLQASVRGGGLRGGGGGRGGRRSDLRLKHGITLLGHLDNGIGIYSFIYNGGRETYVGVIAQQVRAIRPDAVLRGSDGYLRVRYDKLGFKFQTYDRWMAAGAQTPPYARLSP
jgi:hypothetical protein